jgi:hypothetical protein
MDLRSLYEEKRMQRTLFTEQELMDLLGTCVDALIYVQDNGLKHCFLNKEAIVLVGGQYRLLDNCLVRRQHPYYSLLMGEPVQDDVFLAPEVLEVFRD